MDLFELIKVIFRRWKVVVPIGLLTLGVAYYVHTTTPPEFESTGYLQWEIPEYDRANDPIATGIDPVALSEGIAVDGDANFSVSPLDGQYLTIRAVDDTAVDARTAVNQVIEDLDTKIKAIQEDEDVAEANRVDLRLAVPEVVVEPQGDASFIATGQMFLYSPAANVANPYRPDASTGRLLEVAATGDVGRRRFAELAGTDVTFEVGQESRDAAALLQIVTMGSDRERVVDAFYDVAKLLNEDLDARQARADVPEDRRITLGVLDAPLGVTDVSPPVERAVIAIVGLGGLLALGLAVGLESLSQRKARREDGVATDVAIAGGEGGMRATATEASDLEVEGETFEGRRADPQGQAPNGREPVARVNSGHGEPDDVATSTDAMSRRATVQTSTRSGERIPADRASAPAGDPPRDSGLGVPGGALQVVLRQDQVSFPSANGHVRGHLSLPVAQTGPGLIVIHGWWGLTDQIKAMTDRFADEGFVALAPDLYAGTVTDDPDHASRLMQGLSVEDATVQLGAAVDFLQAHEALTSHTIGAVGFGMGGGFVLVLAAHEGDRVGGVVTYSSMGGYEEVDLSKITASVLGHFGTEDQFASHEEIESLKDRLAASAAPAVRIRTHSGVGQFLATDDSGTYDSDLAAMAWSETVAFLRRHLT